MQARKTIACINGNNSTSGTAAYSGSCNTQREHTKRYLSDGSINATLKNPVQSYCNSVVWTLSSPLHCQRKFERGLVVHFCENPQFCSCFPWCYEPGYCYHTMLFNVAPQPCPMVSHCCCCCWGLLLWCCSQIWQWDLRETRQSSHVHRGRRAVGWAHNLGTLVLVKSKE